MADIRFVKPRSDNRIRHFPGLPAQTDVIHITPPVSIDKQTGHCRSDVVHITTPRPREKDNIPVLSSSDTIHITTPRRTRSQNLPYDIFITSGIGEQPDVGTNNIESLETIESCQNDKVSAMKLKEGRSKLQSEPNLRGIHKAVEGNCRLNSENLIASRILLDETSIENVKVNNLHIVDDGGQDFREVAHLPFNRGSERDINDRPKHGSLKIQGISIASSDCSTFEGTTMTTNVYRTLSSKFSEDKTPVVKCEALTQINVRSVNKVRGDSENCGQPNNKDQLFKPQGSLNSNEDTCVPKTYQVRDDYSRSLNPDSDKKASNTVRTHSECESSDATDEAKDVFPEIVPTHGIILSRSPHRPKCCSTQHHISRSPTSYLPHTEKPQRRRPMRRSVSDVALPGMQYGTSFFGFVNDSKFQGRNDKFDPDDDDDDFAIDLDQMIKQLERGRSRKPTRNEWGNIIRTNMHHGGSESALNLTTGDERRGSKTRSSMSSRSESTSSDRLRIRRCALADPERMIMSQEDRERIEKDVQKRRQSMVRKVSQFFNVQLGLNQEEDLI